MNVNLPTKNLYEQDFDLWLKGMITTLRAGQWQRIDIDNLIEELTEIGRRQQRELKSRLVVLLLHLLKWQYQSEKRSNSWIATLNEQRRELVFLLEESPSLKSKMSGTITTAYDYARQDAARETGLAIAIFPPECLYTKSQILDPDFLPS